MNYHNWLPVYWMMFYLGLSYRDEERRLRRQNERKPVRVLGLDGACVLGGGEKRPVLVAVDLGEGQPAAVGYVDEHDPQAVQRWLEPLAQKLGVGVMVTNDLAMYKVVAKRLNLEHQICQFHVRRWVGRTSKELRNSLPKEGLWVLEESQELIAELPPEGDQRSYALWKQVKTPGGRHTGQYTPIHQLRDLLIRLSETWGNFCTFYMDPAIPWTNNGTEGVIGRMKMPARTVRGYKTWSGMQTGSMLAGTKLV